MAVYGMGVVVAPTLGPTWRLDHRQLLLAVDFLHQYSRRHSLHADHDDVDQESALYEETSSQN